MNWNKSEELGAGQNKRVTIWEADIYGKRTWRDLNFLEWIFIVFATLSILISIGFSVYHLILALIDNNNKFIFPVIVILNNIFSAYFLWNGVMEELPFKILLQLVIKSLIWIFDLIFFLMPSKEVRPTEEDEKEIEIREIRFYISSAMLFLTVTTGLFVIYQYWTSNISVFRVVGTEPKIVTLCRAWYFCQSMILFDAVIFITVIFHLCNFPVFLNSYAVYYLLPLWLIVTAAYVILGVKATEKESRILTYMFYVASHFQPIFIIYLLVKASRTSLGLLLFVSLYVSSLFSLLTHVGLLISVVRVQNSYGMGLKEAVGRSLERKRLMAMGEDSRNPFIENDSQVNSRNGSSNRIPPTETEL